jgi:hypothetical protein
MPEHRTNNAYGHLAEPVPRRIVVACSDLSHRVVGVHYFCHSLYARLRVASSMSHLAPITSYNLDRFCSMRNCRYAASDTLGSFCWSPSSSLELPLSCMARELSDPMKNRSMGLPAVAILPFTEIRRSLPKLANTLSAICVGDMQVIVT